jgi:hypothetical protein
MSGFQMIATRVSPGTASLSSPSLFVLSSGERVLRPVTFLPGRARLETKPVLTGSVLLTITIGIVRVCCLTAAIPVSVDVTITSTFRAGAPENRERRSGGASPPVAPRR